MQVNTEENPRLADKFRIRGVPAVLILKSGELIDSVSGAMDRNTLIAWWKRHAS